MKNTPDWLAPDYKIFMLAAELGSLSAVARKINRDVGNLSRALVRLEELHGSPLFVRHASGLRITQEGSTLYRALSEGTQTVSEVLSAPGISPLRIGFSPSIGFGFMPHFFPLLAPLKLSPNFTMASSLELFELLKKRELDFILTPRSPKFPGIISTPLFTTRLVLCSRLGKPARKLIRSEHIFELAERLKGLDIDETVIVNDSFVAARLLASTDDYVGIIPECILDHFPELKINDHSFKEEKVYAITWRGSPGMKLLRAAKESLR